MTQAIFETLKGRFHCRSLKTGVRGAGRRIGFRNHRRKDYPREPFGPSRHQLIIGYAIYRGITTGLNNAFIIDNQTKEAIVSQDPRSTEIIKPVLRGRDIQRYHAQWNGQWIIATFPSLRLDIDEYPAVKKHLLSYGKERLQQSGMRLFDGTRSRKKTKHAWFELQDTCAYHEEFKSEKLLWRRVASQGTFAYDDSEIYCINAGCMIIGDNLKYLCAILNAKVSAWFSRQRLPTSGTGTYHWEIVHVGRILIPNISTYAQDPLVRLTDRILDAKYVKPSTDTTDIETQIDKLAYDLYGLTPEEIETVEKEL